MRIDSTYEPVQFGYQGPNGKTKTVTTLEEEEYSSYYRKVIRDEDGDDLPETTQASPAQGESKPPSIKSIPEEKHLVYQENQKGISFDSLFGPYLSGAAEIRITDPYIRLFYQVRNLMELLETVVRHKSLDQEVSVHLVTTEDESRGDQQTENLEKIKASGYSVGIRFNWEFDDSRTIHARHITTDHGWKISLDRGLDIFQPYEMNDAFTFSNRLQQHRSSKAFEVTFIQFSQ